MKKSKIELPTSKERDRSVKASKKYLQSVGRWEEYGKFWRKGGKEDGKKEDSNT